MSKRKWTNISAVEGLITAMRAAGKTRQEIADTLGLDKVQIKNWINRHNKKQARKEAGLTPKLPGRPRNREMTSEEEYKYEIRRLQMENKLLRDFLSLIERK